MHCRKKDETMYSKENKGNKNLEEERGEGEAYYDHLLIFTIIIHIQLLSKTIYLFSITIC